MRHAWIAILAEGTDAMSSLSPYAALGANSVLVGIAVWLITKHLPQREKEEREARSQAAKDFSDQLTAIRVGFDAQLNAQRSQSGELAKSGHMAVQLLSESFHELALAISSEGTKLTESGIRRHREKRSKASESVLE